MRWQGRLARKVSWLGFYAAGEGKGSLPIHSIKPDSIDTSYRRLADAHLMNAAPELYRHLQTALPHLPDALRASAESILLRARGDLSPVYSPHLPQFDDLV